jgi:hypothetical protein
MEAKYRYRKNYTEEEVGPIPDGYWKLPKDSKERDDLLRKTFGGEGRLRPTKKSGEWKVVRQIGEGERVENPDIADTYNTVLKMADKRAYVSGVIKATAASDLFTQDTEDFTHAENGEEKQAAGKKSGGQDKGKNGDRQKAIDQIGQAMKSGYFTEEEVGACRNWLEKKPATKEIKEKLGQLKEIAKQRREDLDKAADKGWNGEEKKEGEPPASGGPGGPPDDPADPTANWGRTEPGNGEGKSGLPGPDDLEPGEKDFIF